MYVLVRATAVPVATILSVTVNIDTEADSAVFTFNVLTQLYARLWYWLSEPEWP